MFAAGGGKGKLHCRPESAGGPLNLVGAAGGSHVRRRSRLLRSWQLHRIGCILSDVMAFDLIVLGRQLTRIGETAMRGQAPPSQPTLAGMVLADVFAHPRSSISEITARVGMPPSHVSETVPRLREQGTV